MSNHEDYFNDSEVLPVRAINETDMLGYRAYLYPCKVCFCLVPTEYTAKHIEWHESIKS